jgi:hypothetical protein
MKTVYLSLRNPLCWRSFQINSIDSWSNRQTLNFEVLNSVEVYAAERVDVGLVWTRILAQLMLQTATLKEQTE